jgi:two-component system response regulator (stage 0 sporulation protein A)
VQLILHKVFTFAKICDIINSKNKEGGNIMALANVAIFEKDEVFLSELVNFFKEQNGFYVCASAASGTDAIEMLKSVSPDMVIINPMLSGVDGLKVIDYVRAIKPQCLVLVVSALADDKVINMAMSHGAEYYFIKPITAKNIFERGVELLNESKAQSKTKIEIKEKRQATSLDEKISNIFITIGIPPHIKGYAYLREGIKMSVENPSVINRVTKELYPKIGEKFGTTSSKVERAIRHAIEVAWNRGRVDEISSVFGARVYIGKEKPTNSEFIALVADKLILEFLV